MDSSAEASPGVPSAPDWSQIDRDILCPLCEYNLRGLIEPRCPECGHRFEWAEMLSSRQELLPFLFEHRPDRNLWSFFQTLGRSLWSLSFWRTLLPVHVLNLRRLLLFWIILFAAVIPFFVGASVCRAFQLRQRIHNERLSAMGYINRMQTDPYYAGLIQRHGSIQAVVNAQTPMPSFFVLMTGRSGWDWQFRHFVTPTIAFNLLWPWLTLAALLIFRASMREARIKLGHVLRCVLYSHAPILPLTLLIMLSIWIVPPWPAWNRYISLLTNRAFWVMAIAVVVLTWRLAIAYRLYLRFPHAITTVIASQIIVGLALLKAYLVWLGY